MSNAEINNWDAIRSISVDIITTGTPILKDIFSKTHPDDGHGLEHALTVMKHGKKALKCWETRLSYDMITDVLIACLIHDVGDSKFSKEPPGTWECYFLMNLWKKTEFLGVYEEYVKHRDNILLMVDLVSCSKWGDRQKEGLSPEYYIPRYADRLEATGPIGVQRATIYAKSLGRSLYDAKTPRVYSIEEIDRVATPERYQKYCNGELKSATTIDHFYDKCLHIKIPKWFTNTYLSGQMLIRRSYLMGWIIGHWVALELSDKVGMYADKVPLHCKS